MSILVTGATGFLGKYVVRYVLNEGYQVVATYRNKNKIPMKLKNNDQVKWIKVDLRDQAALENALKNVNEIFHVAAILEEKGNLEDMWLVNVEGTRKLVNAAKKTGVEKIVHVSTTGIFGNSLPPVPINEEYPVNLEVPYHVTKYESEKIILSANSKDLKTSVVRPTLMIGSGDHGATWKILENVEQQKFPLVNGGKNLLSFVHVEDVARAMILALKTDKANGEAFNLMSFCVPFRDFLFKIARELNVPPPSTNYPFWMIYSMAFLNEITWKLLGKKTPPRITRYRIRVLANPKIIDISKARKILGYEPQHDLDSTVKEIVQWYLKEKQARFKKEI